MIARYQISSYALLDQQETWHSFSDQLQFVFRYETLRGIEGMKYLF